MTSFVCLLRAVNVSGKNILKMDAFRSELQQLPIQHCATYIQSGNVVFASDKSESELELLIHQCIQEKFGLDVVVMVRSKEAFEKALAINPFPSEAAENGSRTFAGFLSEIPSKEAIEGIDKNAYHPDQFEVIDQTLYVSLPNGAADTKLTNALFEKKLKVSCTMRNWNTMLKLQAMVNAI